MRCGLQVSKFSWPDAPSSIAPTFRRVVQNAEGAGLSSLCVMDHQIWTVDEAVDHYGTLGEVGLDHVIWTVPDVADDTAYELVSELVRQLEPVAAGAW